jgi:hypothetical protein
LDVGEAGVLDSEEEVQEERNPKYDAQAAQGQPLRVTTCERIGDEATTYPDFNGWIRTSRNRTRILVLKMKQ